MRQPCKALYHYRCRFNAFNTVLCRISPPQYRCLTMAFLHRTKQLACIAGKDVHQRVALVDRGVP